MQLATLLRPQTGLSCICPISFYLENHKENGVNRKQPWNPALSFSFLPPQARPLLPGPLPSPKKKKKRISETSPILIGKAICLAARCTSGGLSPVLLLSSQGIQWGKVWRSGGIEGGSGEGWGSRLVSQQRPARLSPAPTLKSAVLTAKLLLYGVIGNAEIPPLKSKRQKPGFRFSGQKTVDFFCSQKAHEQNRSPQKPTSERPTSGSVANDIEMKSGLHRVLR